MCACEDGLHTVGAVCPSTGVKRLRCLQRIKSEKTDAPSLYVGKSKQFHWSNIPPTWGGLLSLTPSWHHYIKRYSFRVVCYFRKLAKGNKSNILVGVLFCLCLIFTLPIPTWPTLSSRFFSFWHRFNNRSCNVHKHGLHMFRMRMNAWKACWTCSPQDIQSFQFGRAGLVGMESERHPCLYPTSPPQIRPPFPLY